MIQPTTQRNDTAHTPAKKGYRPDARPMKWRRYLPALLLALGLQAGCAGMIEESRTRAIQGLLTRASFDLGCASDQLHTVQLGGEEPWQAPVGVQGCGRQATYVQLNGMWVANSPAIEAYREERKRLSDIRPHTGTSH